MEHLKKNETEWQHKTPNFIAVAPDLQQRQSQNIWHPVHALPLMPMAVGEGITDALKSLSPLPSLCQT